MIAWVARNDNGDVVGRVEEGGEEGCKGTRGACCNEDVVGGEGEVVVCLIVGGESLTKRREAAGGGVTLGAAGERKCGFGGREGLGRGG